MGALFALLLSVLAIILILLVLVQRGRGGGLAGALGGVGGSSAFGAKAGDVFTRITIITAAVWIIVCVAAVYWANNRGDVLGTTGSERPRASNEITSAAPAENGEDAGASDVGPAIRPPATNDTPEGSAAPATTGDAPATTGDAPATTGDAPATGSAAAPGGAEPAGAADTPAESE